MATEQCLVLNPKELKDQQPRLLVSLKKAFSASAREASAKARQAKAAAGPQGGPHGGGNVGPGVGNIGPNEDSPQGGSSNQAPTATNMNFDTRYSRANHEKFVNIAAVLVDARMNKGKTWDSGEDSPRYGKYDPNATGDDSMDAAHEAVASGAIKLKKGDYFEHDWNDTGDILPSSKEVVKRSIDRTLKDYGIHKRRGVKMRDVVEGNM